MARVNHEEWLREHGKDATIGYNKKRAGEFEVQASAFKASPAIIKLATFTFEDSAQRYCQLLIQQYQPKKRKAKETA